MAKKILSDDDVNLFRQAVGQVKPVEHNSVSFSQAKPKPRPKTSKEQNISVSPVLAEKLHAEDSMSFITSGLQKNILKKLRKGYFGFDAEIDLHGLNSYEAKRQLLRFLHDCIEDGCRCVHIIHGKGYRSEDGYPILKNNINIWLRQHNDVQAFCSASPRDGGTGAVLVLLHLSAKYED